MSKLCHVTFDEWRKLFKAQQDSLAARKKRVVSIAPDKLSVMVELEDEKEPDVGYASGLQAPRI